MLLLTGLLLWSLYARVPVYAITEDARIQTQQAHRVDALASGRVVTRHISLDEDVEAGALLLELDVELLELELQERKATMAHIDAQLAAMAGRMEARKKALQEHEAAVKAWLGEARAQSREIDTAAKRSAREAEVSATLYSRQIESESDYVSKKLGSEMSRAAAAAARMHSERVWREMRVKQSDLEAELLSLEGEASSLRGQRSTEATRIQLLERQIERRRLRAPISGRIGYLTPVEIGSYIAEGTTIATIIPRGELEVVARFSPVAALGRVRSNQTGRLRLHGFPWMEFSVQVKNVASELKNERVRVELRITSQEDRAIELQHGLLGQIEVEVESVAPVTLVLRTVGALWTATSPRPASQDSGSP